MTEVASRVAGLPGSGSARAEHEQGGQVGFSLFALSGWTFALRTWIATVAALYAAFWLQLGNAYSAAACVAILAVPTRGQAYQKALYRIGGTIIGFMASLAIVGLFNSTRELFILAFAAWIALCGYVASFLDGNRAYGAVLSGFTAAIIAFANIDTPQNVFSVGMDRCATILVGVVAVMVVNDLFGVPEVFPNLARRLEDTHHMITAFVQKMLSTRSVDSNEIDEILKTIVALRTDIAALPVESISGRIRAAAARSAVAAMVRQVTSARTIDALLRELDNKGDELVDAVSRGLDLTSTGDEKRRCRPVHDTADACGADTSAFVAQRAAELLLDQNKRALSLFNLLQTGRATQGPVLPLFRAPEAAFRNALRLFLANLIAASSLSLLGWPAVSNVMLMFAAVTAISTNVPSPEKFARDALVAILLAFAVSGITEFMILDGADSFPLLAIGLAPAVIGPGLLVASGNPKVAPVGTLMLIFTPLVLLVSNPPNYDPRIYLVGGSLNIISIVLLFITTTVLLPTSDEHKRAWLLRSLQRDFRLALSEKPLPYDVDGTAFRDADREVQLRALQPNAPSESCEQRGGLRWVELTSAAWRMRLALRDLLQNPDIEEEGRLALAAADSVNLRLLATRLVSQKDEASEEVRSEAVAAATWMAILIERNPREIAALNKELK